MNSLKINRPLTFGTLILLTILAIGMYAINIPFDTLIVKAIHQSRNPLEQTISRWVLFTFRGSKKEILALEQNNGLNFVIAYQDKESIETFEWLLNKGANVNCISPIDGLTPLHAALLYENSELVERLMKRGANPLITEKNSDLTACEYLHKLQPGMEESQFKAMEKLLRCAQDSL